MALGVAAENLENACQAYLDQPGLDQPGGLGAAGHGEIAGLLAAVQGAAEENPG